MNSRAARFASFVIALIFLFAGVSQAMGKISPCSMPCCQEKSNPCHVVKGQSLMANGCCNGTTTSFALGSGCGPERQEAIEFSTVSYGPTYVSHPAEMSGVEVPVTPSWHLSTASEVPPSGKIPLYLQNSILLI